MPGFVTFCPNFCSERQCAAKLVTKFGKWLTRLNLIAVQPSLSRAVGASWKVIELAVDPIRLRNLKSRD